MLSQRESSLFILPFCSLSFVTQYEDLQLAEKMDLLKETLLTPDFQYQGRSADS